ncbi:uncharacterized protein [Paralichthys olivaceus]|uniref:uncharacterized protein n=1 Tax=Paralichthys olivaceus TaxID=8255 RepID=UPI00374FFE94
MKVLLVTGLLLLLCSAHVLTLQCNTCASETDEECKTLVECQPSELYCKTVTDGDQIYRSCETFCDTDDFTTCCQTDGC